MTINVLFAGETAPTSFLLAHRGIAGTDTEISLDVYTPAFPLGAAIAGKFPGDAFRFLTPSGEHVAAASSARSRSVIPKWD